MKFMNELDLIRDEKIRNRIVGDLKNVTLSEKIRISRWRRLSQKLDKAKQLKNNNTRYAGIYERCVIDTCEEGDKEAGALDATIETT